MPAPLLRFRSDEQLVALFRAGHEEAFRAIHDRYHKRLFAYTRQMLPGRQDAEDALQDVFVRAYAGLRASQQQLALRAWLFRVAHNRCIDELRRPGPPPPEVLELVRSSVHDPAAEVDLRESLRRLIEDIRRLPEQQRSALLMRELIGMSYADLSVSLGISVGAVKSLLVRARVALAQAAEARDTSCLVIREHLVEAHDNGIRPNANARKHMRDCVGCKSFRRELRGMSRQLAGVSPVVGPLGVLAKTLGFSGSAGGGAAGGGGIALLGGGGATASAGGLAVGINHVATLLVAAAATAGGAAAIQHTIIAPVHHPARAPQVKRAHQSSVELDPGSSATAMQAIAGAVEATVSSAPKLAATAYAPPSQSVRARLRSDPMAGGPVDAPATGAAGLGDASRTGTASTGNGAAGLQNASSSTSSSAACTPLRATDASVSASPNTTAGTGTSASTTASGSGATTAPVTQASPCIPSLAPSTEASASTAGGGSSSSSTQAGGSTSNSSSSSSNASPSTSAGSAGASPSGSTSSTSSSSTSSSGGSASATK